MCHRFALISFLVFLSGCLFRGGFKRAPEKAADHFQEVLDVTFVITSVSPNIGSTTGGLRIEIVGTGFGPSTTVRIGASPCLNILAINAQRLECTTSASNAGIFSVVLENENTLVANLSNGFSYVAPPSLSSLSSGYGSQNGGDTITIQGMYFELGATVRFGSTGCLLVDVLDSSTIQCTTARSPPGTVDVTVENPGGFTGVMVDAYEFEAVPMVDTVVPSVAPTGTRIRIDGAYLEDVAGSS